LTAWVIPIGAAFPEHWTIARNHGAWDLTRRAAIEASDDVIFWLGGASVLAWVRATSAATSPIPDRPIIPWEDRETSRYVARFTFEMISEDPVAAPPWGQVQENIGTRSGLNRGPVRVDGTKGIHYLRSLFRPNPEPAVPTVGQRPPGFEMSRTDLAQSLVDTEYEHSDTHVRRRVLSAVVRRRGQHEFRRRLLAAYGGGCAVTGSRRTGERRAGDRADRGRSHAGRRGRSLRQPLPAVARRRVRCRGAVGPALGAFRFWPRSALRQRASGEAVQVCGTLAARDGHANPGRAWR